MKIRLYHPEISQESQNLDRAQSHYVCRTLRGRVGEALYLFNERDGEWLFTLSEANPKSAKITRMQQTRTAKPLPPVFLYFAPIKRSRIATIFAMATELGATHLIPIHSRYCQADIGQPERVIAQLKEAAEQCERLDIPTLLPQLSWRQAMQDMQRCRLPIFAAIETGDAVPISVAVDEADTAQGVNILIGPEGGFHAQEISELHQMPQAVAVDLGERILRSETAVASALAQYQAALAIKIQLFPRPTS